MKEKDSKNQAVDVKVIIDPNLEYPVKRIYSNYVQVQHTQADFTLRFCDATPIFDLDELKQNNNTHRIPVLMEVIIPSGAIPNLIAAITKKWEEHQKGKEDVEKS